MSLALVTYLPPRPQTNQLAANLMALLGRMGAQAQPHTPPHPPAAILDIIDVEATPIAQAVATPRLTLEEIQAARAAQPPIGYAPNSRAPRMVYPRSAPGLLVNCTA